MKKNFHETKGDRSVITSATTKHCKYYDNTTKKRLPCKVLLARESTLYQNFTGCLDNTKI
jgi:hypothetical protein